MNAVRPTGNDHLEARPSVITVRNLRKTYGAVHALDGLNFDLREGEIHGLCGHNGAGKSTLVKALGGLVEPDSGTVEVAGRDVSVDSPQISRELGIAIVEQELSLIPNLSVADNVMLGNVEASWLFRRDRSIAKRYLAMVGLEDVDPSTPVQELRLGERQLVEVARMLSRDARVLILDEPTATLSQSEIDCIFSILRRLSAQGRSILFITHRLGEVFEFCDRVSVVRDGVRVTTETVLDFDRRSLVELLAESEGISEESERHRQGSDSPIAIAARNLRRGNVLDGVTLEVRQGEIAGIAGQVGSGATEVLRALAGLDPDAKGELWIGGERVRLGRRPAPDTSGIAYVPEDRGADGVFGLRSVAENLTASSLGTVSRWGVVRRSTALSQAQHLARSARVDAARLTVSPLQLSGGNQQKVLIGRALGNSSKVPVLLLSEPTRGVDIASRTEIYDALRDARDSGAAILFASTDLEEILELADVVYTMFRGQIVAHTRRGEADAATIVSDMTQSEGVKKNG